MEAESSRKRKNVEANLEEEEEEQNNSLCEKNEEETIQEDFDKLTRKLLLKLKKSRGEAIEHMSLWKRTKKDGIDGSLLECLDLTLYEVVNYLDLNGDYCRGFVQLDQTTAKEEIEKEIKFWENFGDLCTTESNAYKEFLDTVIYPKTIACFRKLKKIEGVIDKVKNDPTLGGPWTMNEIDERLMATWDGLVWDEESLTRFKIVRRLINLERWYGQEDASAATAEYTVEKYEDLIREVVELSSYDNAYGIVKLLTDLSTYASFIASALRKVLLMMMK